MRLLLELARAQKKDHLLMNKFPAPAGVEAAFECRNGGVRVPRAAPLIALEETKTNRDTDVF